MYKVAIVEDEKNLAMLVEKYLKNEGYDVLVFNNGEDAIEGIDDSIHLWILEKYK